MEEQRLGERVDSATSCWKSCVTSCLVTSLLFQWSLFEIRLSPSFVSKECDMKFIPLLFHLMIGWCSTLNFNADALSVGSSVLLPLFKFGNNSCFWPKPEPFQSQMQLLQWPPKMMIASEAWEKGKIILVGWFCFLQRQPFQLESWDQLEGSPFTMLVGGSKTSLGLVPAACSVHMHLHASFCSAGVGAYWALRCMLGVCAVCGQVSTVQGPWGQGGHCSHLCSQASESLHSRHRRWGALLGQLSHDPHLSLAGHTVNHRLRSRWKPTLFIASSADGAKAEDGVCRGPPVGGRANWCSCMWSD